MFAAIEGQTPLSKYQLNDTVNGTHSVYVFGMLFHVAVAKHVIFTITLLEVSHVLLLCNYDFTLVLKYIYLLKML